MRSGWERKRALALREVGPFGYGHQHEDKLGVTLTAFGKPLLVEGGVYTYDASEWRRYVLSSRAHNVVLVDGQDQCRRKEPRETYVVKRRSRTCGRAAWTLTTRPASYSEGWGTNAVRVVKHTRHVFFSSRTCLSSPTRRSPKTGRSPLRGALSPRRRGGDGRRLRVATQGKGPSLSWRPSARTAVSVVKVRRARGAGLAAGLVQWLRGHPPDSDGKLPQAGNGQTTVLYALFPSAGAGRLSGKELRVDGNTLTVTRTDGPEKSDVRPLPD
jgi:hypothetical protein